jgi:arylsulfatase A-like enzyme
MLHIHHLLAPKPFVDMYDTAQIQISTRTRDKDQGVPDIAVRKGRNYDIFNGYYPQFSPTPERQKLAIQAYYATSSFVDAQIGRLIKSLEDNGLSDNTIVCVVADHGFHLGEHGCWSKFTVFEESNRVPFVLYVPGAKRMVKKLMHWWNSSIFFQHFAICGESKKILVSKD